MTGLSKSVQRNPLIPIIEAICRGSGFRFRIEQGSNHHTVYVIGVHNNQQAELKFPFPRICDSFRTIPNFKAKFSKFVQHYTKEINFLALDPAYRPDPERKSTFVQKAYKEPEKKVLTTPTPMLVALQEGTIFPPIMPHFPNSYVGDKKRDEPMSDHMVLAVFLMDMRNLSTVVEVCDGIAKFRGSKPAPLRILGTMAQPRTPEPTPPPMPPIAPPVEREEPAKKPPMNNVVELAPKRKMVSAQSDIITRMSSESRDRVWSISEFSDLLIMNSLTATMSLLTTAGKIRRVARGKYALPLPEKKKARK